MAKPNGFVPAVQRYTARFNDGPHDLMVLTLGAQSPQNDAGSAAALDRFATTVGALAQGDDGPMQVDHARFVDGAGYTTRVCVAYWADQDRYRDWWTSAPVQAWWHDCLMSDGPLGYFAEPAPVRSDTLETVLFREYVSGLAACPVSSIDTTGESGYWGAARDRIPQSATERFECPADAAPLQDLPVETTGRLVRIMPSRNHCLIRSGVSWAACGPTQLSSYESNLLPRLNDGMAYLDRNPIESGCWSVRQVDVIDEQGRPRPESWVGAHFLSLGHLEAWAHRHPTHLAIYGQAQAERVKYQDDLELRTYHEVYIIEDPMPFEYHNCHPTTGALGYFAELHD